MTPSRTPKCPSPAPSEATLSATFGANLPHTLDTRGTSLPVSLLPCSPPPLSLEPRHWRRTPLSLRRPFLPPLPGSLTCRSEGLPAPRGQAPVPGIPSEDRAARRRRPRFPEHLAALRRPRWVCAPERRGGASRRASAARSGPLVSRGAGADSRPLARRRQRRRWRRRQLRRRQRAPRSASRAAQPGGEREGDGNGGGAARRRRGGRRREGSAGSPEPSARSARSFPRPAGGSREAAMPAGPAGAALPATRARLAAR